MSKPDQIKALEEVQKTGKAFAAAAADACGNKRGLEYKFTCPICSGSAHAVRSTYNGHLWAGCDNCGAFVMQ